MGKIKEFFQRFMAGRYGADKLNQWILGAGVICSVISMFISVPVVNLTLSAGAYALLIWAVFRMLSRNTYKRYQENRRFLAILDRLKDREHKYFKCPKCRQSVRVPKGKGKIKITCPKCGEKFQKKS